MTVDEPAKVLFHAREVRATVAAMGADILLRWEPMLTRGMYRESAANLAHYLALRCLDLRPLEAQLKPWGLLSLGQVEGRVMESLDAVIANLEAICSTDHPGANRPTHDAFGRGARLLEQNTNSVFGPPPDGRWTRILVTLSRKAAKDKDYVPGLFRAGMDCARINCARDSENAWAGMIDDVRRVSEEMGRPCRVLMDLGGPKIRTRNVIAPAKRTVRAGDRILLTHEPPVKNPDFPFQADCSIPGVLRQVAKGAKVSIRDGRIAGRVEAIRDDGVVMVVERTPPDGQPLEAQRGINFPGTALQVSPLTDADMAALDFVAAHADIVSYSFVQRPEDIARLQDELAQRRPGAPPMPIVAKVETQLAFANLPEMIVQAAGGNPFAVMIARGDLAVEIGYERLSEVQEEILWLCEAAHVPVIWATQVLESLVKLGMPSRGEFTDAAMAERAECVMLNKGKFVGEGIAVLDNVLRRMEAHTMKRNAQLRPLAAWGGSTHIPEEQGTPAE